MKSALWLGLALLVAAANADRADAQSWPAAPVAPVMSDEVRAHWERGLAEYTAGRYPAAGAEFATCYRLAERRECLFAWAQSARLGGDCETAAALYRRYLQAALSPRQIEAAKTQLAVCEAAIVARTRRARAGEPWYRDGWGDALVIAGAAGLAAATWLYIAARRDASATEPTYGAYEDRFHEAERTRTWSLLALGAGSAAVAAGVAHMVLRRGPSSSAPEPRIGLAIGAAELAIRYTGRF